MDRPYGISDFAFPTQWDRESGPDLVERAGQSSRRDRKPSQAERERGSNSTRSRGGFGRSRTIYRGRDREYSLRETEVRTLTDLGRFRVVPEDDLARFGYQGNRTRMEGDVRNLIRTTMNIYTQAIPRAVREANRRVVRSIMGKKAALRRQ